MNLGKKGKLGNIGEIRDLGEIEKGMKRKILKMAILVFPRMPLLSCSWVQFRLLTNGNLKGKE